MARLAPHRKTPGAPIQTLVTSLVGTHCGRAQHSPAVKGGTSQTFGTVAHRSPVTYAPPLMPTPAALGLSCWQWLARAQQLGSCRGVLPQLPQAEPEDSTGSSPMRMFPSARNSRQEVGQLPAWHALQAHAPETQPSTPSSISAPGPLSSQGPWWRVSGLCGVLLLHPEAVQRKLEAEQKTLTAHISTRSSLAVPVSLVLCTAHHYRRHGQNPGLYRTACVLLHSTITSQSVKSVWAQTNGVLMLGLHQGLQGN